MIFKTKITIPWHIDRVFDALNAPSMMQQVAFPLVIFKAVRPTVFPERWDNGATYRMKMYLFGVLPLGWQELSIRATRTTDQATLTDVGPGFAVKLWDHNVVLTKQGDSKTQYDETLTLTAGFMAPIIWIGMTALFAWRKYRWLSLTR